MYRLVVSDIDGTLVDGRGHLREETKQAIHRLQAKGVLFTLSTGRNITKALPIARQLDLRLPFFCIDGILAFDRQGGVIRWDAPLKKDQAQALVQMGLAEKTFLEINDGYRYYIFLPEKRHQTFDLFNRPTPLGRMKSYLGGVRYLREKEVLSLLKGTVYQVVLADEPEQIHAAAAAIRAANIDGIEIRDQIWDGFLFLNRKGMGKERSIQVLSRQLSIPQQEIVAFGDDTNDIGLLQEAGLGIAMGNAHPLAKAAADRMAPSNEENGVAVVLGELFETC